MNVDLVEKYTLDRLPVDEILFDRLRKDKLTPFVLKKCFDPTIFTWQDVNTVFNNFLMLRHISFIGIDMHSIPVNYYNLAWSPRFIDTDVLFYGLKNGFTISVNSLHSYNETLKLLSSKIERIFDGSADIHLYFSHTDFSNSFGIHKDRPFNLILQTEGECEWKVWEEMSRKPEPEEKPFIHTNLLPGDAIYVPREVYHQCIPKGPRASLSIPVHPDLAAAPKRVYDIKNMTRIELTTPAKL